MQPSIPVPTDNIYKFSALFGVVLVIFAGLAGSYVVVNHNETFSKDLLEWTLLNAKENPSLEESTKRTLIEGNMKQTAVGRSTLITFLLGFGILGLWMSIWGATNWHRKVQPVQDELLDLQIEKMRREIQVLEKQLEQKKEE